MSRFVLDRRAAMSRGVIMGRKPSITTDMKKQISNYLARGVSKSKIAIELGISRQTIYNVINSTEFETGCKIQ